MKDFLNSLCENFVRFFGNIKKRSASTFKRAKNRVVKTKNRFQKNGGFGGLFSRTVKNVKRGDIATIVTLALVVIFIAAIPVTIIVAAPASNGQTSTGKTADAVEAEVLVITPPPAPTPEPTPEPTPMLLVRDVNDPLVATVQERLMDLGYMDWDEPTELYGPQTENCVELFQRTNGLEVNGTLTQDTYDLLMGDTAKTYMVTVGIEGTDVSELQKRLQALGYISTVTGYFGTDTKEAVQKFQSRNGLDVDGMVGVDTRELLYSEDANANAISYGEKSDAVLSYQKRLYKLGYLTTEPDGTFGRDTVAAVKLFQQRNGLIADGFVGPETKDLLMSSDAQKNAMTIGMSGATVEKVQKRLKELNYLKKVTSYYGSDTETAVRAFQKRNGLSQDGKVGSNTMTKLFSSSAKKAASDYTPAPQSTNSSSTTTTPKPDSGSSGGSSTVQISGGASADNLITVALSKLGTRYVGGGKGPDKFDCSGFVYWCLNQIGVKQSYYTSYRWRTADQYQKVTSLSSLRKGDIIVFRGHVAIAVGDGTMIDASSGNGKVVHRSCTGSWCQKYFLRAWRIF